MSDNFSFKGWDIGTFLKGRKKMIITLIATGLSYGISSSVLVAAIAAPLADITIGVIEYYVKSYN